MMTGLVIPEKRSPGGKGGTKPGRILIPWRRKYPLFACAIQIYFAGRVNIGEAQAGGVGSAPNWLMMQSLLDAWKRTDPEVVQKLLAYCEPAGNGQRTIEDNLLYRMRQRATNGTSNHRTAPTESMLLPMEFQELRVAAVKRWPWVLQRAADRSMRRSRG